MDIEIREGTSYAKILGKGAELRSLKLSDKELMWRADPAFWGKSSPVLFPMIGNLRGGKTLINGKEYAITKHGFARDNEFEAKKLSDNSAEFTFGETESTMEAFPFAFELKLTYTLSGGKLHMDYSVTNGSDTAMPYCIGAHPAFACPNEPGAQFSDHKLVFEQPETVNSPVMNLQTRMWGDSDRVNRLTDARDFPLEYSLFDNDCVYFDTIKSKSVSLVSAKTGKGVKLTWSGFTTLGVWTPDHKNAPFVCIEPWCGCDDYDTDSGVFAEKRGIQIARPGETKNYSIIIEEV